MDVFENVLSDGADADAKLEAELASDTDAVVSVIYPEQAKIGRMLSTAEGAPSPLFRGLQLVTVAAAVAIAAIAPDVLRGGAGMACASARQNSFQNGQPRGLQFRHRIGRRWIAQCSVR